MATNTLFNNISIVPMTAKITVSIKIQSFE